GGSCPAVWTNLVKDLRALFIDKTKTPSQFNDYARATIPATFHDCGTWNTTKGPTGGYDGAPILAYKAGTRPENNGLQDISTILLNIENSNYPRVGVADLIQVASYVTIATCSGGPVIATHVGRKDSAVGNSNGGLPDAYASDVKLFAKYYQYTLTHPMGVKPFASDSSLAADTTIGKKFKWMAHDLSHKFLHYSSALKNNPYTTITTKTTAPLL
ncbi:heme peroxidase, partial [Calycina marina]